MSNNGYIKLRRSSQDNPLYFAEPFTRWQARQDLLLLANHSEGFFYIRGNRIDVKRGQVARGEKDLCARRKRSRDKTRKFLNDLEKMQQIIQQKNRICSIYIITNYDRYQTTDKTTDQTTEKHQTRQQKNINNKNKEETNKNKEEEKDFSLLRDVRKNSVASYKLATGNKATPGNREKAKQSYMKSNATLEQVQSAIELYFKEKTTNKEYVQHFSTWLNQKGYEQEWSDDEPPVYTQDHVTRFFQNKLGETYTTIPDPQLPEIYPGGQLCRAEDYRRSYISRLNHTKRIEWNKDRDKLKNLYNANPLTYCDE